jgi:hypothetical protein
MGRGPETPLPPEAVPSTPSTTVEQNPFTPPLWGAGDNGCIQIGGDRYIQWENEHSHTGPITSSETRIIDLPEENP